jgi:uncharacterized repeat protein (TIGR01451 family)
MSNGLQGQPRRGVIFVLAATIAGLGLPGLHAASQTCEVPPLTAKVPQKDAQLGWSLSADGRWLAAGANLANASGTDSGAVALYLDPKPGMQPTQEIPPPDVQPGDQFGSSVSISGEWLAVGAPVGDGKVRDSGVVYLFQLVSQPEGPKWVPGPKLDATDAAKGHQFGISVSLSGTTLVVGAPGDSDRGSSAGAAYVFEMQGTAWQQTAKLSANDGRPFDEFGSAVATSGDEIVIGAPFADDLHALQNFGAAYVFKKIPNVGWALEANGKLTAGEFRSGNIQFGSAVAIGGHEIAVGAPGYDHDQHITDSGSVYVFEWNGSDWTPQQPPLIVDDPQLGAQLGTSLQIDGHRILIGAPFDGSNAGAAYLFEKQSGSWIQSFKFLHVPGGAFGQSVALLGNQVFMGGFEYTMDAVTHAGAVATCPFGVPPQPPCASSINKTDHQRTVQTGQTVTYQIDVVAALPGSTVSDTFPPELGMVGWCRGKDCTNFAQKPLVDTLTAGGDVTYQVRGRVRAAATGEIKNEVCVDGSTCQETCASDLDQIKTPVELSCVKTGPEEVNAGDMVTYRIVVSNAGGQAANSVALNDHNSTGLQFLNASTPCVGGFPCALPPVTVTFQVPSGCGAPTSVTNTASVVGSNTPETSCSMTTAVRIPPQADLGVSASAPAQVAGGDSFKLSAVVTNAGPHTAQGATADVVIGPSAIIDSVPAGCTAVPNQPNHFTCSLGGIACGDSRTLNFMVHAPACAGCVAGTPIDLSAEARSQTSDPTLPNRATATVQVNCPSIPSLSITQTDSPDPVVPGQGVVYDITVKNAGTTAVTGAVVRDDFPSELQAVRWCRGAGCTPNLFPPIEDTIDLAAGETRIYRLSGIVQPMCSAVLHNKATITPPAGVCDDPSDNQSVEDTQVAATGVHAFCEGISGPLTELSQMTQTFLLINCGPANQADNPGDEFTDVLPAGLTLVSATATSGTVSSPPNTVHWNGAIPVGGTVTITFTANINAGTTGMTLCNQATINYDADGDGTNESTRLSDDPDEPGPADPCCFRVTPPIPTLSGSGLAALALLLAGLAMLRLRRRPL